jgi:hypothetical protein
VNSVRGVRGVRDLLDRLQNCVSYRSKPRRSRVVELRVGGKREGPCAAAAGPAIVAAMALCACRGGSGDLAPIRLLHSPPVSRQSPQQLRALSMECEQYPPHGAFRGRFDAAYCEEAIAAWADSPLQLVVIPGSVVATPATDHAAVSR